MAPKSKKKFNSALIWLIVISIMTFILRINLLDIPLERDEGEYGYFAQLMLDGIPPYTEAYNMKYPGTHTMYAVFITLFGQSTFGIHLGLALMNIATIVLIYLSFRRIFRDSYALVIGAVYGALSASGYVMGFAAHATHFVLFFSMLGFYLLLRSFADKSFLFLVLGGISFGLSLIMKQSGIFFVIFGFALCIIYSMDKGAKSIIINSGIFTISVAIPFLLMLLIMSLSGVFDKFWFWTYTYLSEYGSALSLSSGFDNLTFGIGKVTKSNLLLWILAIPGLLLLFISDTNNRKKWLLILFVFFSLMNVIPGLYFRQHYFIVLLPAIGVLYVYCFEYIREKFRKSAKNIDFVAFLLTGFILFGGIIAQKDYYFETDENKISKDVYSANPFVEIIPIAEYIKLNSEPGDEIAVLGSEPELFFYTGLRSATGYIYTYNMVEIHDYALTMQKEMIEEIEESKPRYLLSVEISTSWLMKNESERHIIEWLNEYADKHYRLVAIVDLIGPNIVKYEWEPRNTQYQPKSQYRMFLFERKGKIKNRNW